MRKIILGILLATMMMPATGQTADIPEKLEELMTAYVNADLFNGSVLVTQNNQVIFNTTNGFSDVKAKQPNEADTKYLLYSITKSVTATAILKLAEQRKLSLNDNLSKFYPTLPNAEDITVEHLLTHTSGIYNYNNDFTMPVDKEESIIEFLRNKPLDFAPGTDWNYSNTGYFLLGFIIQKVTGTSYATAVEELVFRPLQMNDSGFDYNNLLDPKKSKGYEYIHKSNFKEAFSYDNRELFAAGGMYSTTSDLYKFHQAMQANDLISASLTEKAHTPYKQDYGYGWFIEKNSNRTIISHSGGASGFRSYLVSIPEDDICIILLCNSETSEVKTIKDKMLNILFDKPYVIPRQVNLSTSQLSAYEGAYKVSPQLVIYVTVEKGRLIGNPSRQSSSILLPQSDSVFYVDEIDAYIEFKKNNTGVIDTLILTQGEKAYVAPRVPLKWGITGSATSGGWDGPDIELTKDENDVWIVKNISLGDGEIKFRFNNDWTLNYGTNEATSDLKKDGTNIHVSAGVYDILLDLTDSYAPTHSITKAGVK